MKSQAEQSRDRFDADPDVRGALRDPPPDVEVRRHDVAVAADPRGVDALGLEPLIEEQPRPRPVLTVHEPHVLAREVRGPANRLGVAGLDEKACLPGREGHQGDGLVAEVPPDEGQVGLARTRVHDVESGDVDLTPLERLYGRGAAHRPSEDGRGLAMLPEALRHELDGGVAPGHDDLPPHDALLLQEAARERGVSPRAGPAAAPGPG